MRTCGDCQLCCRLLPVPTLAKPANQRCRHQRHRRGCSIYPVRPAACMVWRCKWLDDEATGALSRPDRSHYIIDPLPDYITLQPDDGGEPTKWPVLQIWIDPAYPDAHHDPKLRAMLDANRAAALIRPFGLVIAPPSLTSSGRWIEQVGILGEAQHSIEDIQAVFASATLPA